MIGRDQAAPRMPPAHQGFHGVGGTARVGSALELGLIVQGELTLLDGEPQLALDRQALAGRHVECLGEVLDVVSALLLGVIHRRVGMLRQGVGVQAVIGIDADSDAGAGVQPVALDVVRLAEGVQDLVSHHGRVLRTLECGEHDDELVPALAGDDVALAHLAA